jgi:hypothetical protein
LAVFNYYLPWDDNYSGHFIKKSTKNVTIFDPYNTDQEEIQTKNNFTSKIKKLIKGLINIKPTDQIQSTDLTIFTKTFVKDDEDKKDETAVRSRYEVLSEYFKRKDLDSLTSLLQEAFYRSSFTYNENGIAYSREVEPPTPTDNIATFLWFDIVRIQNLDKIKPLFDDFATFPTLHYEYSRYFLMKNAHKFDYHNAVQRSGSPFFFISDRHKIINHRDNNELSPSNIFGILLVTVGAASLLSFTFF